MAYLNGFYYNNPPSVGSRCLFVKALDLWRGSELIEPGYEDYLFPSTVLEGTILAIAFPAEGDLKSLPRFEFTVCWESGEDAGKVVENETSQTYVILKSPQELEDFLQETRVEVILKLEAALITRKNQYADFAEKLRRAFPFAKK